MNYSLRHLLLFSLLSASMCIWGITAFFTYKVTRDEVASLFDAELAQSAKVLHSFIESLLREGSLSTHWMQAQNDENLHVPLGRKHNKNRAFQLLTDDNNNLLKPESVPTMLHSFDEKNIDDQLWGVFDDLLQASTLGHKYERKIAFQLWSNTNGIVLHSDSAPVFVLSSADHGFSETNIDGHLWYVFSIASTNGEYVIHVGQKEEIRTELTDEISMQLVMQFLVGLPILGLVIWFIVGRALAPLNRLEIALSRREASYLKPLSIQELPNEIVPIVHEINTLFVQLEQAFEHERQFTADAAHELRTPLAGLLTQAQVALRTADETVRNQALKRIEQAVHRMTYLVQQLLTFSRIDSNTEYLAKAVTHVEKEIVQVITELDADAYKKRIHLEFVEEKVVPIMANTLLINILLRNIIDNAIKYTPQRGSIKVSLVGTETQLIFSVEDSGSGIAPDQYENSLKRFHRCVETAHTAQGTGLGFSIVQRIAGIHQAELALGESELGGLKVKVTFNLPPRATVKKRGRKLSFFN
ncbi:MAG: ATP-binding protein [Methylococcales bacterium]|nr:ATP-binding protein [Methylococcales bacterium]MDD5754724.1 ATP-binding protein [Methylococcales bacterium]